MMHLVDIALAYWPSIDEGQRAICLQIECYVLQNQSSVTAMALTDGVADEFII